MKRTLTRCANRDLASSTMPADAPVRAGKSFEEAAKEADLTYLKREDVTSSTTLPGDPLAPEVFALAATEGFIAVAGVAQGEAVSGGSRVELDPRRLQAIAMTPGGFPEESE